MRRQTDEYQSNIVGVKYGRSNYPRWEAVLRINGIHKYKSFSIKEFGFEEAKRMAEKQRLEWNETFDIETLYKEM